jgi:hypothetical protein
MLLCGECMWDALGAILKTTKKKKKKEKTNENKNSLKSLQIKS